MGQRIKGKKFDSLNLQGINLEGTNLSNFSFIEANISQANLRNANLEGANLSQTKLVGAKLKSACLTGACIDGWVIDETTELNDVTCEYVYLEKLPGNMTGWRRDPAYPELFSSGEFVSNYGRNAETVQFRIRKTDNQKALDVALRQIVQSNPEIQPNSFHSIETLGDDALIAIRVPRNTDKERIRTGIPSCLRVSR